MELEMYQVRQESTPLVPHCLGTVWEQTDFAAMGHYLQEKSPSRQRSQCVSAASQPSPPGRHFRGSPLSSSQFRAR